jgi:hypothetical protein
MTIRSSIALLFALLPSTVVAGTCWTYQPNCRGKVDICNCQSNVTWSYTIWHGSTGGRENFTLRPGEHHIVTVQTGDKMSSVSGSAGVPDSERKNAVDLNATF